MKKILFRTGILQIFFVFTFILCAAISFNFYYRTTIVIENLAKKISERSAEHVITQTHEFLAQPANYGKIVAQIISTSSEITNIVDSHQRIWRMLWQPLKNKNYIQSMSVADNRGNYVQVRRNAEYAKRYIDRTNPEIPAIDYKYYIGSDRKLISEKINPTSFDPRVRPWFVDAKREGKLIWSDIFISTSAQAPTISVSKPIADDDQIIRGVITVNILLYHISKFIDANPINAGSLILIADKNGQILEHSSHQKLLNQFQQQHTKLPIMNEIDGLNIKDVMLQLQESGSTQLSFQDIDYTVLARAVPNRNLAEKGWRVLFFSPTQQAIVETEIDAWLGKFTEFINKPEQIVTQAAKDYRTPILTDIITARETLWDGMWQNLINNLALQSFFVADDRGNYVQVRREPHLATRIINRDKANKAPLDEHYYRLPNFELVAHKIKPTSFDPRQRPWYQGTTSERRIHWSEIFVSSSSKTPVISATYPILPPYAKAYEALVGVNLPLYQLSDFFAKNDVSNNGFSFMIDGGGRLIAHADKSQILIKDNGELRMRLATESDDPLVKIAFEELFTEDGDVRDYFTMKHGKQNYLVAAKEFPTKYGFDGWKVLTIIPERDLLSDIDAILLKGAAMAFAIFIFSVFIVYLISNRISRPLRKLAVSTSRLTDFQLDEIQGVKSRFIEVDALSNAILSARDGLRSFQKYVPADLVRQLIKTNQSLKLGGQDQELTMMFTDIANFTAISENLPAQDLMLHLSHYLDDLTKIIMEENGTVDKYIGDAIMAFWGAPVPLKNPISLACRTALRCQNRLIDLNKVWEENNLPIMETRIGLATGNVVVGNLGSSERMNYTVIGDSVNLASRLEGLNKFYGTSIIVSEKTQKEVKDQFQFRFLDKVAVKGQSHGIPIYELLAECQDTLADEIDQLKQSYEAALDMYMKQHFDKAKLAFEECLEQFPDDLASKEMLKRCEQFLGTPPNFDEKWDGTFSWQVKG